MRQRYLIALGSNKRHHRFGAPERVLAAALAELERRAIAVERAGPVLRSAPLGPSLRRYANSAALVCCDLDPEAMLGALKAVERQFGRRAGGQRWSSRVLDLDVVLWSGGCWSSPDLTVPHREFRNRGFVLRPAAAIAPDWRDPISGRSLRQLCRRSERSRPIRT